VGRGVEVELEGVEVVEAAVVEAAVVEAALVEAAVVEAAVVDGVVMGVQLVQMELISTSSRRSVTTKRASFMAIVRNSDQKLSCSSRNLSTIFPISMM